MLQENLIKMYEASFRENHNLPALSDYFSKETLTYLQMAEQVARLHLLYDKLGIKQGDKIALIGRNNINWCVTYIATITYGAVIVPILQDFNPSDVENIVTHSESKYLFAGEIYWQTFDSDRIPELDAAVTIDKFKVVYEKEGYTAMSEAMASLDATFAETYPQGFSTADIKYNDVPNESMILLNYTSYNRSSLTCSTRDRQ